jgi:hypothetical protein
MTRLVLTLTILFCTLSSAKATLAPRLESFTSGKELPAKVAKALSAAVLPAAPLDGQKDEYRITDQTEVVLDGRACKYQDVPNHAAIVKMEVAGDKRTVVKIYFRTRK